MPLLCKKVSKKAVPIIRPRKPGVRFSNQLLTCVKWLWKEFGGLYRMCIVGEQVFSTMSKPKSRSFKIAILEILAKVFIAETIRLLHNEILERAHD